MTKIGQEKVKNNILHVFIAFRLPQWDMLFYDNNKSSKSLFQTNFRIFSLLQKELVENQLVRYFLRFQFVVQKRRVLVNDFKAVKRLKKRKNKIKIVWNLCDFSLTFWEKLICEVGSTKYILKTALNKEFLT